MPPPGRTPVVVEPRPASGPGALSGQALDIHSFTSIHHQAHLVAAAVPEDLTNGQLRILGAGCRRLALSLPATADFAVGMVRNEGTPEFRCLFVALADAEKFGAC